MITNKSYSETLAQLTADKWQVVSEGPSGAQLKQPKKMKPLDTACAALGAVCLFFAWPLGVLLIGVALLDLVFFTKERTHFLSREQPALPT